MQAVDFDLHALLDDLIELLAPRAHQKRIELAYRLAVEEAPLVQNIRNNVITFITPVVEVDGREKIVDARRVTGPHSARRFGWPIRLNLPRRAAAPVTVAPTTTAPAGAPPEPS